MSFATPDIACIERTIKIDEKLNFTSSESLEDIFDVSKTVDWIKSSNFDKVCLQLPDKLLGHSVSLCKRLKTLLSRDVYILADTTYNSCCIDEVAAKHISADAIVHYGHTCLSPATFPVLYVYDKAQVDTEKTVEALRSIEEQKVVIFYDVSLEHLRETLCQKLFEAIPHLLIGVIAKEKGSEGLVFGRSIVNRDGEVQDAVVLAESHLVFLGHEGPTMFNLAVSSQAKELHLLDIKSCTLSPYSQSQWFKRRRFAVEKCKDAKSVGILVCTLSIRNYGAIIQRLKRVVRGSGKKCYTLTVGKPNVAKLANLSEIDVFVLVACPENELYSSGDFLSPIVYPYELELALNRNRNPYESSYVTDFNELLPEGRNYKALDENGTDHLPDVSLISGQVRNINVERKLDKESLNEKEMQLDGVRKSDWAVTELGIGKAISDRSWRGLERDLDNTKVELAKIGRKGIASSYDVEPF